MPNDVMPNDVMPNQKAQHMHRDTCLPNNHHEQARIIDTTWSKYTVYAVGI